MVCDEIGVECVGVCFVLFIIFNGMVDDNLFEIYIGVVKVFNDFNVVYLYIVEVDWDDVFLME